MLLTYSIIIPVYNRPFEVEELLNSIKGQNFKRDFEVIIIEDGSYLKCDTIVDKFKKDLQIDYFFKENSGPGLSRNFGMTKASGNYFIILDSDVLLPENYLFEIDKALNTNYTDAFGGADASHISFTIIQKAIN